MTYSERTPQELAILAAEDALEHSSRPTAWLNTAQDLGAATLNAGKVDVYTHDEEVQRRGIADEGNMFHQQEAE